MKNSIIIPFHSNDNLLSQCLYSISKTIDVNDEIIVVANNAEQAALKFDFSAYKCKVIYIYENLMYPKAINVGASYANGENFIFCDADTSVFSGWLHNFEKKLDEDNIGYVSAKLIDMQTKRIWEFGTACSTYNFPHPYKNRLINFELCKKDKVVMGACAACSAIKSKTFEEIGGFDERLICSYSDLDLSLRLREKGLSTVCVANSLAYHQGGSTIGSGMGNSLKEDTKGLFTAKHPNIRLDIQEYIQSACEYFHKEVTLKKREYFEPTPKS